MYHILSKFNRFFIDVVSFSNILTGEEEGRPAGLSSMDSSRRRISGPILNSGPFSKQKSPVAHDSAFSKEALVCIFVRNTF